VTDPALFELPRSDVSAVPPQGGYVAKRCPVRAQLDNDTSLTDLEALPVGVAVQARIDGGREFETQVLDAILAAHPDAVRISTFTRAAAQADTLAALQPGVTAVINPDLPDDPVLRRTGRPDLLIRHADGWVPVDVKHHRLTEPHDSGILQASRLDGPLDLTAAVDGVRFQKGKLGDDALQLAHYWRMLQHHGLAPTGPAIGGIVDRDGLLWWVDLDQPLWKLWWSPDLVTTLASYDHEFAFRLDVIAHTLARNDDPTLDRKVVPVWTSECTSCPWRQVCRAELEAADHVSLLPRSTYGSFVRHRRLGRLTRTEVAQLDHPTALVVGGNRSGAQTLDLPAILDAARDLAPGTPIDQVVDRRKKTAHTRLAEAGISTVGDLARLDPDTAAYAAAKVGHLPTLIDLARAATSGRAWRARGVETVEVRRADVEVDVDMENTESGAYLWGALVRGDTQLADGYVPHVTWEPLDPAVDSALFAGFWAWLTDVRARAHAAGRTFAAYYFTPAEDTQMRRIVAAGGLGIPTPDELEAFIASEDWVDLHQVFAQQIITGEGTGLKRLAPMAGFHWRDDDPGGDQSMVWYADAVDAQDPLVRDENRTRLLQYNEDDVRATAVLRDWIDAEGPRLAGIEGWTA
jgi:predicted RecB family nuclease